jgi:hypothetical protein
MRYLKVILVLGCIRNPIWSWKHRDIIVREWKAERV